MGKLEWDRDCTTDYGDEVYDHFAPLGWKTCLLDWNTHEIRYGSDPRTALVMRKLLQWRSSIVVFG